MTNSILDQQEMLAEALMGLRVLASKPLPAHPPALLSRRWTVFQVPSATTPNYLYYVVGSKRDGWRCSCVGWQASGGCYHARAVVGALELVAKDQRARRNGQRSTKSKKRGRR